MTVPPWTPQQQADWWAAVRQPPRRPRLTLWARSQATGVQDSLSPVGSVEPRVVDALSQAVPALFDPVTGCWEKTEQENQWGYALKPDFSENLARIVHALQAAGCCGPWRHERVPVADPQGRIWAEVERGGVRVLGLSTQAVHLVGLTPGGRVWVQQRSWHKPNDPGLWDTLMGGTVSAGESLADTLVRETWEEAGLHLPALADLKAGGRFTATRPVPDGGDAGHLVEDTHWYTATVPDALLPCNQDGEVDHFEAWTPAEVAQALAQGRFTPEARWVLAQVLFGGTLQGPSNGPLTG